MLVEKILDPDLPYTKWNTNNGYVNDAPDFAKVEPVTRQARKADAGIMMEAIDEEDEEEADSDDASSIDRNEDSKSRLNDDAPKAHYTVNLTAAANGGARKGSDLIPLMLAFGPKAECYARAFSHFSYRNSRRKMLVCNLQGVQQYSDSIDESAGVFKLI